MQIKTETITPSKAQALLKRNTNNRSIRPRKVLQYARAIERGEWNEGNPEPIKLNGTRLLDGQHRLLAIVEANMPQKMWVARGVPESAMTTIDTGMARSLSDTLKLEGYKYPHSLAALLRQVFLYKSEKTLGGKNDRFTPSHGELLDLLRLHPELQKINDRFARLCHPGGLTNRKLGVSIAVLSAAYWVLAKIDREDAEVFIELFLSGADLGQGNAILALRKAVFESRYKPKGRVLGALFFKAWNDWREGEKVYRLTWSPQKNEPFPRPR